MVHFIAHMCNAHWQTRKARLRQIHVLNFWQEVETQALHHLLVRSAREAGEDPLQGPVSFVHVTYEPLGRCSSLGHEKVYDLQDKLGVVVPNVEGQF